MPLQDWIRKAKSKGKSRIACNVSSGKCQPKSLKQETATATTAAYSLQIILIGGIGSVFPTRKRCFCANKTACFDIRNRPFTDWKAAFYTATAILLPTVTHKNGRMELHTPALPKVNLTLPTSYDCTPFFLRYFRPRYFNFKITQSWSFKRNQYVSGTSDLRPLCYEVMGLCGFYSRKVVRFYGCKVCSV